MQVFTEKSWLLTNQIRSWLFVSEYLSQSLFLFYFLVIDWLEIISILYLI